MAEPALGRTVSRPVTRKERHETYLVPGLVEFAAATPFVVSVAAGTRHSVAVDVAGDAYAWGEDGHGQLGLGYVPDAIFGAKHVANDRKIVVATKVRALSDRGVRVVLAAAARYHTMYLGARVLCTVRTHRSVSTKHSIASLFN